MRTYKVDISHKTIFFIAAFVGLLWAIYQIRGVLILLFLAIIFMSALAPVVSKLENLKIPKTLAIGISYIVLLGSIGALLSFVTIPLIEETTHLAQNLPTRVEQLLPAEGPINRSLVENQLSTISGNAVSFIFATFDNFIAFISVAVLTFYLLVERDRLDHLVGQFFVGREERARTIFVKIEDKLGAWLRGQIALSLIIGVLSYLVLFILGVPYALPLAIVAGVLEVVPTIGPIIASIAPIIIAYTISPLLALMVGISFFIIQQLENNLIVPQVMKRAVGLNPLIVILAVAIGSRLLGIAGALLAVPITVVVQIIIEDVLKEEKIEV